WLVEDPCCPAIKQILFLVDVGLSQHETVNNGCVAPLDSFQSGWSVQSRHLYVEEHEIDPVTVLPEQVMSIGPTSRQPGPEAAGLQLELEQGQDQRHVIGNQDARAPRDGTGSMCHFMLPRLTIHEPLLGCLIN